MLLHCPNCIVIWWQFTVILPMWQVDFSLCCCSVTECLGKGKWQHDSPKMDQETKTRVKCLNSMRYLAEIILLMKPRALFSSWPNTFFFWDSRIFKSLIHVNSSQRTVAPGNWLVYQHSYAECNGRGRTGHLFRWQLGEGRALVRKH